MRREGRGRPAGPAPHVQTDQATPAAPPRPGPLVRIDPLDVFDVGGAQAALKLTRSTIRREVKLGRLRISKRAGRHYILGRWLLEWLAEGEVPRPRPAERNGHAEGGPP